MISPQASSTSYLDKQRQTQNRNKRIMNLTYHCIRCLHYSRIYLVSSLPILSFLSSKKTKRADSNAARGIRISIERKIKSCKLHQKNEKGSCVKLRQLRGLLVEVEAGPNDDDGGTSSKNRGFQCCHEREKP